MLLIGMLFECQLEKYQRLHVLKILAVRLSTAALFALTIYYYSPFSMAIKQVVILTTFSPIPISTTIFTEKCGADAKLYGICSSFSIPISIIIMTSLLTYWNRQLKALLAYFHKNTPFHQNYFCLIKGGILLPVKLQLFLLNFMISPNRIIFAQEITIK